MDSQFLNIQIVQREVIYLLSFPYSLQEYWHSPFEVQNNEEPHF